jgi:hypothetical protein
VVVAGSVVDVVGAAVVTGNVVVVVVVTGDVVVVSADVVVVGAELVVDEGTGVVDVETGTVVSVAPSDGSSPIKSKRRIRPMPRVTVRPIAATTNLFIPRRYFSM